MNRFILLPHRFVALAILLASTGALTGCNLADNNLSSSTEPVSYQLGTISGAVHGGFIPIVGSRVQIWATQNNGYGGIGLLLAEANSIDNNQGDGDDTDSNGNFTFSSANYVAGCPAGQQVYITSSGGNTGAGANSNLLLMAVLGSCASLYSSTAGTASTTYGSGNPTIVMDEVTTAAAAYALANFIEINGNGTSSPWAVNISAPVTNNFSDGTFAWNGTAYAACSGTACNGYASFSSGTETTYSNGLAHAFKNAVNMVNISTGLLYSYITNGTGATSGGSAGYGVVPRATLNTVANAMQTCVNSVSSTASLSSNCSGFFNATPSLSNVTPTNTLQAAVNLAKNPYSNSTNVAAIDTLATAQTSVYSPYLSSAPNDWSASIVYKNGGFNVPYNLALDANDNAYTNNTGSGTSSILVAISANGTFLYGNSGVSAVDSGGTALTSLRGMAADSNGYIYSANEISSISATPNDSGTFQFTASTGAYAGELQHSYVASDDPIPDPAYVAVTRRNDIWTTYASEGSADVDWWQCNGGNNTSTSCAYSAASISSNHVTSFADGGFSQIASTMDAYLLGVAVDGNQNVWTAVQGATGYNGNVISELTNYYAATQSSYPAYDNSINPGSGVYVYPKLSPTTTTCGTAPYTFAFDSSNNAWFTVTTSPPITSATTPTGYLCKATVTTNGTSVPTSIAISSPISVGAGIPEALAMDGNGVLWIPMFSYNTSSTGYANYGVQAYNTSTPGLMSAPTNGFTSCYVSATATGASTCTAGTTGSNQVNNLLAISNPRQAAIDSAGNLWLNEPDGSTVTETLGIAAPTVPLLSAGKFGVKP